MAPVNQQGLGGTNLPRVCRALRHEEQDMTMPGNPSRPEHKKNVSCARARHAGFVLCQRMSLRARACVNPLLSAPKLPQRGRNHATNTRTWSTIFLISLLAFIRSLGSLLFKSFSRSCPRRQEERQCRGMRAASAGLCMLRFRWHQDRHGQGVEGAHRSTRTHTSGGNMVWFVCAVGAAGGNGAQQHGAAW